jgi:hypothetical protein
MTRKSRRELAREIEDLRDDRGDLAGAFGAGPGEIEVASEVVTVEDFDDEPEVTVPDDATLLPTESDVVTWWVESAE